jgi:predicted RNase H-like nuclease
MPWRARSKNRPMSVVAGIDGCRGGWLCLVLNLENGGLEPRVLSRIDEVSALDPRPDLVMIDIPIGLVHSGPRPCDLEARRLLGRPRSSSVFPAPIRPVLAAESYAEACSTGMTTEGKKLSRQSWAILGKVREVDAFIRSSPGYQGWIREVHPEVSFWCWNSLTPMKYRKKSTQGFVEREKLIIENFREAYLQLRTALPRGRYGRDDLMDAFAALWTAERVHRGKVLVIPADPPLDEVGLRMEIVA